MGKDSRRRSQGREDRAWSEYGERFRAEVLPFLLESAVMLSVGEGVPERIDNDVIRAATELGLMLLLGKPLLLLVPTGVTAPPAMRRAAAIVLEDFDATDPDDQERMVAATRRLGLADEGQAP